MKKTGMLNRDIARVLASLGHTDTVVIADCGLPIPSGVECIDLSIRLGTPTFSDVLEEVLKDMEVEGMVCANEVKEKNAIVHRVLQNKRVPIEYVSHEMLKAEIQKAKAVIRTGERTPYANAILRAGVIF